MLAEFIVLENKVITLIELCKKLVCEKNNLQEKIDTLTEQNVLLLAKIEEVKRRVENLIVGISEEKNVG